VDLKEIKLIVDLMTKNNLSEFQLEREGFKIHLKKEGLKSSMVPAHLAQAPLIAVEHLNAPITSSSPIAMPAAAALAAAPSTPIKEIVSPMVGTFYRSASPEAASYIEVGQEVNEDTVVCIIEAMKVMNEIKAEVRGTISEALIENGKSVEFGKPLFRLKSP